MNSEQWEKLETLIEQALDLPAEERDRFLDNSCGENSELRSELRSLLKNSSKVTQFTRKFSENVILPAFHDLESKKQIADTADQIALINKVIKHYQILEKSGSGGMGVVYKARDLRLDRYVAIKLLPNHLNSDSSAKTQFISEAKAVSALDHPNICTLHDISETDAEHLFMTMAWYEGETLRQKLKKGAIEPRQAIDYAIQAADGLAAAHQAGITHRDIKPSNIMITDEGLVKILDFGIAKTLQSEGLGENSVMGSPAYMSPEQVRGQQIDHRSDIWSLGVVLYEMLAGERPFRGQADAEMLQALLKDSPAPIDGIPEELARAVMKCLEKDPAERYQHIGELNEELIDLQNRLTSSEEDGSVAQVIFSKPVLAGGFLLALFMLAALVWHSSQTPVVDAQPSIAVLPLENLSPDPEDAFFTDGIHEEIISSLSGIGALRVIARSSVEEYPPGERNLEQVAQELNVSSVMEGTVRRAGDRIRVSMNLIDLEDYSMIWSETYEDQIGDIFDVQSRISQEVAGALQATLTPTEVERLEERPTENPQAYQYYLQAREYLGRSRHQEAYPRAAVQLLHRALEEDPHFAYAWALLAVANSDLYWLHGRTPERLEQIREAAEQAQQLAPDLAETMLAQGLYHYWSAQDHEQTLALFEEALKQFSNHHDLHLFTALTHRRLGNWAQMEHHLIKALELDPRNSNHYIELSVYYYLTRDFDRAITVADQLMALTPDAPVIAHMLRSWSLRGRDGTLEGYETWRDDIYPADPAEAEPRFWTTYNILKRDWDEALRSVNFVTLDVAYEHERVYTPRDLLIAEILDHKGDREAALEHFERARLHLEDLTENYPDDPRYRVALGKIFARTGNPEKAVREGRKAVELRPLSRDVFDGATFILNLAYIYTWSGYVDEAIDQLELLLSFPSIINRNSLQINPDWDPIREHPRFQALVAETE